MTKKAKSNRLKLTTPIIRSRAEMEALVREIAELTLTRNKQQTELDLAITTLRARYEESLGQIDQQLAEKTECGRAWAEANPADFKGLKSLELTHGTIGFRTGQPQLKPRKGWTWTKILFAVKMRLGTKWVRTKEEVNREQIIADRNLIAPETMTSIGCEIVQEESFFIDPKIEENDNRQTVKEAA
jgi:phage host-nuclease inhibitor protein Gam